MEETPTLLVTRESGEYGNVFHTMTDLLNVYISASMMRWQDEAFQVILLDSHPLGPLDPFWGAFSPASTNMSLQSGTDFLWHCSPQL